MDLWIEFYFALSEKWAVGVMGCRSNGLSELWALGIMLRIPSDCLFGIFKLFLGIMIACEIVLPATIFHIQPLNIKSIQSYLILPYLIHVQ